jgi:predicted nuclease of predicted toxin-antitoxin system
VPLRILTDENLSPTIAEVLQHEGLEVYSAQHMGLCGVKDPPLIRRCEREGLTLVTKNAEEFLTHHQSWMRRGEEHAGFLTIPEDWPTDRVRDALRGYLRHPDCPASFRNRIAVLPEPPTSAP